MMTMLTGTSTHRITKKRTSSFLILSGRNVHAANNIKVVISQVMGLSKKTFTASACRRELREKFLVRRIFLERLDKLSRRVDRLQLGELTAEFGHLLHFYRIAQ